MLVFECCTFGTATVIWLFFPVIVWTRTKKKTVLATATQQATTTKKKSGSGFNPRLICASIISSSWLEGLQHQSVSSAWNISRIIGWNAMIYLDTQNLWRFNPTIYGNRRSFPVGCSLDLSWEILDALLWDVAMFPSGCTNFYIQVDFCNAPPS